MRPKVTVIDYGVGNLFSVCGALEHCGVAPLVTGDPDVVCRASKIILPGVGAFGDGMARLSSQGLGEAVTEAVKRGAQLLGICLGMQLLLDASDEFGLTQGLGLIPGRVVAVPEYTVDGKRLKIPHIGWNSLIPSEGRESWRGTILDSLPNDEGMYFVHSFMVNPLDSTHRVADCLYGDTRIAAAIAKDNICGVQFHPEKSGKAGLAVLRRFVEQV